MLVEAKSAGTHFSVVFSGACLGWSSEESERDLNTMKRSLNFNVDSRFVEAKVFPMSNEARKSEPVPLLSFTITDRMLSENLGFFNG